MTTTSTTRVRKPQGPKPPGDEAGDSTMWLLERAQGGDHSAARILLERALPGVRRWSHGRLPRYSRGAADTEDVVQDAVVGVLKRLKRFNHRTVGALQAYLRKSVVNRIRDLIRRSNTHPNEPLDDLPVPADEPSALEGAILREQIDLFYAGLRQLRPADRQIVIWKIELGYSVDDIARRLGKSKPAAAMAISRALARLKKAMNRS
jgi:RNA polymerase sigma-70 factor, ECF subfamily